MVEIVNIIHENHSCLFIDTIDYVYSKSELYY